ncbi:MAG: MBL fold metallo-hydrolase [Firmicutes bacterium]|nr:MBL fold metallo-hydrolase [Bacillota bacterium]
MKLTFSGAAHEVTGSCHCLTVNGKNILVDCGMEQGKDIFVNQPIPFKEKDIDYVFLTHAHIDHSGMLPQLYARGFRGKIYATEATVDLCGIMLRDAAHIQEVEAEWENRKRKRAARPDVVPAYTLIDAEETCSLFAPCKYGEMIDVAEGIRIRFSDIGHMLGSACIEVWMKEGSIEKKIVFSGDVGNLDQPIVKDPAFVKEADYIVIESTYGSRYHKVRKFDYVTELSQIIDETFDRGGNVVIPSFAIGRTQEMLYFLREVKERGVCRHKDFEVYVDSPMAIEATEVFKENTAQCYDEETMEIVKKGINPISFDGLKVSLTAEESKMINRDDRSKVIIASSGMCEGGRIRHHLKHNLWRTDSTILFVGYQSIGTLGRMIADGAKEVKIFGDTINVGAEVKIMAGVSGHADRAGLMRWLGGFESIPDHVFVVHGEDTVCTDFAAFVEQQFGFEADAPYSGSIYDLAASCYVKKAEPVRFVKDGKGGKGISDPFSILQKLVFSEYRTVAIASLA